MWTTTSIWKFIENKLKLAKLLKRLIKFPFSTGRILTRGESARKRGREARDETENMLYPEAYEPNHDDDSNSNDHCHVIPSAKSHNVHRIIHWWLKGWKGRETESTEIKWQPANNKKKEKRNEMGKSSFGFYLWIDLFRFCKCDLIIILLNVCLRSAALNMYQHLYVLMLQPVATDAAALTADTWRLAVVVVAGGCCCRRCH